MVSYMVTSKNKKKKKIKKKVKKNNNSFLYMAELYASYMLGSVTVAFVSKMLYNYTYLYPETAENIIEFEPVEELFKCIECLEEKPSDCFSEESTKKEGKGTMEM